MKIQMILALCFASMTLYAAKPIPLPSDITYVPIAINNKWVMEGPGLVEVTENGIGMKSLFYDAFMEQWLPLSEDERAELGDEGINQMMYEIALVMDPQHAQDAMTHKGFRGGHTVYWLNQWLPKNIMIEYDFLNVSEAGLYINFFAANAHGKSIFDPSLEPRNGVFDQYTAGDFQSYHISFGARFDGSVRGTSHLRKNPGSNEPLTACEDIVAAAPYQNHKIRITKWKNWIEFRVDDEVCMSYNKGIPEKGFFGLRQMSTSHAYYNDIKIYELK